jgi:hypothetical protein
MAECVLGTSAVDDCEKNEYPPKVSVPMSSTSVMLWALTVEQRSLSESINDGHGGREGAEQMAREARAKRVAELLG